MEFLLEFFFQWISMNGSVDVDLLDGVLYSINLMGKIWWKCFRGYFHLASIAIELFRGNFQSSWIRLFGLLWSTSRMFSHCSKFGHIGCFIEHYVEERTHNSLFDKFQICAYPNNGEEFNGWSSNMQWISSFMSNTNTEIKYQMKPTFQNGMSIYKSVQQFWGLEILFIY